ncbi:MAG TPA: FtsX-like permease family protein, partial [Xanthobacteraceae bacterium]
MSAFIAGKAGKGSVALILRLVARELRGGVRGFAVFIACIALGVMAIAAVGSFARSLTEGLDREGRTILGGDIAFALINREATAAEREHLASKGALSATATMRAMVRTDDTRSALVELKAVDAAYPLFGTLGLEPGMPLAAVLAERDGVFGAAADPALLARLSLPLGARVSVGSAKIEIRAVLQNEPDRLSGGIAFGPRLLVSEAALRATSLLQPGSLHRWTYKLRLPENAASDEAMDALVAGSQSAFPQAGWEARTRFNAAPQLERNIERFMQFLTLVGLTALLVGGVGVANAVKSYVERKRDVIATMKALGASGTIVVAIYLTQVLLLAGAAAALGATAGALLPFAVAGALGAIVPLPLDPAVYPDELALAVAYGLLTALAFGLWPLGRAHDVPVSSLFRDHVAPARRWPRRRYLLASALAIASLVALAVFTAFDRKIALIFVAAAFVVLVGLRGIAWLLMVAARAMPRARSTIVRLAVTNIHRPGALTPTVVLSLGLGLALLVTVTLIDSNLRRQFTAALPERAPAFYLLDIQQNDVPRLQEFVARQAPGAALDLVPMLRGRITAVKDTPASAVTASPQAAWALQGDRGITYADKPPEGSRLVAGSWWKPDYAGPPLVSLEKRIADGIGLKRGDTVTVNVLGRNITATVANLRTVDWQSLGINFVFVYSPSAFRGAPHTSIATLTYQGASTTEQELAVVKALATEFPHVTVVRIREALETVGALVG